MANKPKLLDGVTVLEISSGIAAALCGRMMADLGAEVIKLEIPPGGDCTRDWMFPPPVDGVSPSWVYYNRGKQCIAIDVARSEGAAAVRDLARRVDILIENLPPGELAKYELDYERLHKINPRLVMCSISPYGQAGPLASAPGDDTAAQALSALSQLTGNEDGSPVVLGQRYAEGVSAVNALGATMAAMLYRDRTGQGQYIDLALYESVLYVQDTSLMQYVFTNGESIAFPTGAHRPGSMPCGMYRASDGYIVFTILQPQDWEWFITHIGHPEMAKHPHWSNPDNRFDDRYQIIPLIEQWLQTYPKRDEVVRFLLERHLLAGSVLRIDEAATHPQIQSRGVMEAVEVPGFGSVQLMKLPYRFSNAKVELASRIARFGEDNAAVLRKYLGYDDRQIDALAKGGVLLDQPGPPADAPPQRRTTAAKSGAQLQTIGKPGILGHIKVLEITNYLAGPTCARILADLGAEVVKVEIPPIGDYMRRQMFIKDGLTGGYAWFNRGKQSVCIDLKRLEGASLVLEMAPQFDVVVQNMTPGTLDKHGLGYEAFNRVNPRIVMCSISGYGQDGPWAQLPGNDTCSQAMAGVIHLTCNTDGSPVYSGIYLADMNGGVSGFAAIMAALYSREKTGVGQHIDIALSESLFHLHDVPLIQYFFSKGKTVPQPDGPYGHGFSPAGMFRTGDGYITLTVADDPQWRRLAQLMGKAELGSDPRYAGVLGRYAQRHELTAIVEEWMRTFEVREELVGLLRDNGLAAMPVYRIDEMVAHPQLAARGSLVTRDLTAFGPIPLPMPAFRYTETSIEIDPRCALLGEDNQEVLGKYLNYKPEQVDELLRKGLLFESKQVTARRQPS
jgi:crotonobetainyl-CoA:carnitine CoA-transferase CaiB-like acyl-CoA transferase